MTFINNNNYYIIVRVLTFRKIPLSLFSKVLFPYEKAFLAFGSYDPNIDNNHTIINHDLSVIILSIAQHDNKLNMYKLMIIQCKYTN